MSKWIRLVPWLAGVAALAAVNCSATRPAPSSETAGNSQTGALSGCNGQASSTISPSGSYYLTSFGGPGDGQSLACGGNSDDGNWYYAASSQRYGCGTHVQVTANGNCVVAETEDYGPDVCVEAAAGGPILDASPLLAMALFGESELGWSDHAAIQVTVVDASVPLGMCAGGSSSSSGSGSSGSGSGSSSGSGSGSSGSGSGSSGSGSGSSGSGSSGAGSGSGSSGVGSGSGSSGGTGGGGTSGGTGGGASSGGTGGGASSGGTGGGGTSGGTGGGCGGTPCNTDGDCNPGNDGSGLICVNNVCVPGCDTDAQCPGSTTCVNGMCQ
jgi:hypothetical protein